MAAGDHRSALNMLRGIAATWVVVYHFRHFSPWPWFERFPAMSTGYMGVDFFFVLSGLIICHVYAASLGEGRETYGRFLFLRFARIFPVHLTLMLALLAGVLANGAPISPQKALDWITLTLLVRQWLLPAGYAWNSPAWSVSAEMFAYTVVFAAVLLALRHLGRACCAPLFLLAGTMLLGLMEALGGTINVIWGPGPLIRVTGGFLIGSGLYCLLSALPRGARWDWAIVGGALLLPIAFASGSDMAFLAPLCAITAGAYMTTGQLGRWMESRPLFWLGEISFSLYMCHVPVLRAAKFVADAAGVARGPAFCLAALVLAMAIAALLWRYIEVPARTNLRRLWDSRHQRAITAEAG